MLRREDLDQLLGYVLLDYSHAFAVGIYAARFGHFMSWPLGELWARLAGRPIELAALRQEFAHMVRVELPAHRTELTAARLHRRGPIS